MAIGERPKHMNCTHPDHNDKETCANRTVPCHKSCQCCNADDFWNCVYEENSMTKLTLEKCATFDKIILLAFNLIKIAFWSVMLTVCLVVPPIIAWVTK